MSAPLKKFCYNLTSTSFCPYPGLTVKWRWMVNKVTKSFSCSLSFWEKGRGWEKGEERELGAALLPWSDTAVAPFPACGITSEQLFSSVKTLQRLLETDALVTGHSEYQKAWVELRSISHALYLGKCLTTVWQIWVGTATRELPPRRWQRKQQARGQLEPAEQL